MTIFYLYEHQRSKPLPNRVILSAALEKGANLIRIVEADSWGKARDKINEMEFAHKEGYGYF